MEFEVLEAPRDEEGYTISFAVTEDEKIRDFFDLYGFVVVENVISSEEADNTVKALFARLQSYKREGEIPVEPFKPHTYPDAWPLSKLGFLGSEREMDVYSCSNRQSPKLYRAFCSVLGNEELLVSHLRFGLIRPTKSVEFPEGVQDKPDWMTQDGWLHIDSNPVIGHATAYGWDPTYLHPAKMANGVRQCCDQDIQKWNVYEDQLLAGIEFEREAGEKKEEEEEKGEKEEKEKEGGEKEGKEKEKEGKEKDKKKQKEEEKEEEEEEGEEKEKEKEKEKKEEKDPFLKGNIFEITKVQGILALIDTPVESGGFCCVPGIHRHVRQWAQQKEISEIVFALCNSNDGSC